MIPIIAKQANVLTNILEKALDSDIPFDAKDIATRFTLDAVGSCAFGMELETMTGSNQDFKEAVKEVLTLNWRRAVENLANRNLLRLLRFKAIRNDTEMYFKNLISYVKELRLKNNIERNDLFQYLLALTNDKKQLTCDQMSSQLFSFFIGGFETSSVLITFALLELALHPDIQEKLRHEICDNCGDNCDLKYEKVVEMDYLDKIILGKLLPFNCNGFLY